MPDFHAAVLMAGGLSLRSSLILTALVAGSGHRRPLLCVRIAHCSLVQNVATLATLLFLLNGGLGFIYFFRDWWQSDKSPTRVLEHAYLQLCKIVRARNSLDQHRRRHDGAAANQSVRSVNRADDFHESSLLSGSAGMRTKETAAEAHKPRTLWLMVIAGMLAGITPALSYAYLHCRRAS